MSPIRGNGESAHGGAFAMIIGDVEWICIIQTNRTRALIDQVIISGP
jgi:hypothetical protein